MSKNNVTEEIVSPTDVISIIEIIGSILGGVASVIKIGYLDIKLIQERHFQYFKYPNRLIYNFGIESAIYDVILCNTV